MRACAAWPRRPGNRHAGFTLMELMVVLTLIGIMVAMILPEMRGTFEHEVLRSTGRHAVQAMHIAYSQSITAQRKHRVRVDRANNQLLVESLNPGNTEGPSIIPLTDLPGAANKLDARITIEVRPRSDATTTPEQGRGEDQAPAAPATDTDEQGDQDQILFFPDGTSEAKEMLLRDREGFMLALRVNPITSRVQVIDVGRR